MKMMPMPRLILICISCAFVQKSCPAKKLYRPSSFYTLGRNYSNRCSHILEFLFLAQLQNFKAYIYQNGMGSPTGQYKVGLMCNISGGMRKNVKETLINIHFISLWRETEREREIYTEHLFMYRF